MVVENSRHPIPNPHHDLACFIKIPSITLFTAQWFLGMNEGATHISPLFIKFRSTGMLYAIVARIRREVAQVTCIVLDAKCEEQVSRKLQTMNMCQEIVVLHTLDK